jgi:hypothetical protein
MAKVDKSPFRKLLSSLKWTFLIPPGPFSDKATINWKRLGILGVILAVSFIAGVLCLPQSSSETGSFTEKKDAPLQTTPNLGGGGSKFSSGVPPYSDGEQARSQSSSPPNRNTPMILSRQGDISTQLPPGTKFQVVLLDNATITSLNQPVIGIVPKDVVTDFGTAIPQETKIFGDAGFDREFRRANVQWKSVVFPDGRSKNISAIALAGDNQPGIDGDVHSDAFKNTVGSLVTHFIAGAADGSITRTFTGQSQGGLENGLLSGASETAHERADMWAEDLKKERAWIDLKKGTQCLAILIDGFTYREPGGFN